MWCTLRTLDCMRVTQSEEEMCALFNSIQGMWSTHASLGLLVYDMNVCLWVHRPGWSHRKNEAHTGFFFPLYITSTVLAEIDFDRF